MLFSTVFNSNNLFLKATIKRAVCTNGPAPIAKGDDPVGFGRKNIPLATEEPGWDVHVDPLSVHIGSSLAAGAPAPSVALKFVT